MSALDQTPGVRESRGVGVPEFMSEAWCRAVVEAAGADPQAEAAGRGWRGDVALVVESPEVESSVAVWARPENGQIAEWRVLASVEEVGLLQPTYVARASMKTWQGLYEGTLDPVEAVLFRKLRVVGDIEQLVERIRYKGLIQRVLAAVETTFP